MRKYVVTDPYCGAWATSFSRRELVIVWYSIPFLDRLLKFQLEALESKTTTIACYVVSVWSFLCRLTTVFHSFTPSKHFQGIEKRSIENHVCIVISQVFVKHASSLLMERDTLVLLWPPEEVLGTSITFTGYVYQYQVVQFGTTTAKVAFSEITLENALLVFREVGTKYINRL